MDNREDVSQLLQALKAPDKVVQQQAQEMLYRIILGEREDPSIPCSYLHKTIRHIHCLLLQEIDNIAQQTDPDLAILQFMDCHVHPHTQEVTTKEPLKTAKQSATTIAICRRMIDLKKFLWQMVVEEASNLILKANSLPTICIDNKLHFIGDNPLLSPDIWELLQCLTPEVNYRQLEKSGMTIFGKTFADIGRLRVSVYLQMGQPCN